jgi:hypothetical protein
MSKSLNLELLNKKSASALNSPESIRRTGQEGCFFAFLSGVAYDLEGLGAGAGQFSKSKPDIFSSFMRKEDVS